MASIYTPTSFYKDDVVVVAESWEEHWQLLWDGYHLGGPPAEVPRTGQHVTFGDLSGFTDRLADLEAAFAAGGSGGGGSSAGSSISFDDDGVPYLNDQAGAAGSSISFDTDGVPYLLIGA